MSELSFSQRNRVAQAAGSWSVDACCAVPSNECHKPSYCFDRASSSDWLFGLWPGPPQRFEPTGTHTGYQRADPRNWPEWGDGQDLDIGGTLDGSDGRCLQGNTYRGTNGEICGGKEDWGATDVEVWYPR